MARGSARRTAEEARAIVAQHGVELVAALGATALMERHGVPRPVATAAFYMALGAQGGQGGTRHVPVDLAPATGRTHLVIGDAHAVHGEDLRRFRWLGRMVAALKPDVVVNIGDWYSNEALCHHNSPREQEGLRVRDDIAAGDAALDLLEEHAGAALRRADLHVAGGNHGNRINRLPDEAPAWEGVVGDHLYSYERRGWAFHPYRSVFSVDGCDYAHHFCNPGTGKSIGSSVNTGKALLDKRRCTSIAGHNHQLHYHSAHVGTGRRRIHGLTVGCFTDYPHGYAGDDGNASWWRGIVVLRNVRDGDFDLECWSMDRVASAFGD